jgi:hypothetical protein
LFHPGCHGFGQGLWGCSSTNEHFAATLIFTKKAEREMFMTLDTREERFDWLKRKYEWMTKNDVPK